MIEPADVDVSPVVTATHRVVVGGTIEFRAPGSCSGEGLSSPFFPRCLVLCYSFVSG